MAVQGGEDVYATLLLSDTYLPGALVLAHSLRDAGTSKKLAILVTLDTVSAEVISQLKTVYDYVIPVPRIKNETPANLTLMNRADLHSAFTKIQLWKLTQYRKIVYIDADVVAYRAVDELFDLPHAFSAAPDIGWPDLFNTGLMALTPNLGDYYALVAMAERGISFDGADQGLLNMYFKNDYNRLSFTYNVTPSAHYQYIPAYRHFQSSINMVHFIGPDKPWFKGRQASDSSSPYDEISSKWWAVYDRHYKVQASTSTAGGTEQEQPMRPSELVQYFVKGEYQPTMKYVVPTGEPHDQGVSTYGQHDDIPPSHIQDPPAFVSQASEHFQALPSSSIPPTQHHYYHHHHHHHQQSHESQVEQHHQHDTHDHHHHHQEPQYHYQDHPQPGTSSQPSEQQPPVPSESFSTVEGTHTEARKEQESEHQQWAPPPPHQETEHKPKEPQPPPMQPSWDAQRMSPPPDSQPEAANFPSIQYEMSSDVAPFVPPKRYPSPPRNMWYEVPKEKPAPPTEKPRAIFPWETHQPRASRVFANDPYENEPLVTGDSTIEPSGEPKASFAPHAPVTEPSVTDTSSADHKSEPQTPTTPTIRIVPSDPWSSFTRINAWDDVPQIDKYVDALPWHRRTKSQGTPSGPKSPGSGVGTDRGPNETSAAAAWRRHGSKLTDFPTEVERPSLPVTPAPIRRPKFWGGGGPGIAGEGEEDDEQLPTAQGVPRQSDWDPVAQLQKLAKQQSELLLRKLGGGEDAGGGSGEGGFSVRREIPDRPLPFGSEDVKSPTYVAQSSGVLSPQPVKPGTGPRNILSEQEAIPRTTAAATTSSSGSSIPEPAYHGPGVAWEKDEDFLQQSAPMPPTEEEEDVLDA